MADVQKIREKLTIHPDFPKKVCHMFKSFFYGVLADCSQGINFLDLFPVLRDPILTELLISHFITHIVSVTLPRAGVRKIDAVVGLDARGFLLGPVIALRLGAAFVPVRKKGKLPGQTVQVEYQKEYAAVSMMQIDTTGLTNGD
jgi:adenine phosphoribosyltransferase